MNPERTFDFNQYDLELLDSIQGYTDVLMRQILQHKERIIKDRLKLLMPHEEVDEFITSQSSKIFKDLVYVEKGSIQELWYRSKSGKEQMILVFYEITPPFTMERETTEENVNFGIKFHYRYVNDKN